MKAKLIVEGKEFPIEIHDPELQKLLTPQKKTGYERVEKASRYYYVDANGFVEDPCEDCDNFDDDVYNTANYYSSETVAQNNARADKLMRQLRRFAVEHRNLKLDWNDHGQRKYFIHNDAGNNLVVDYRVACQFFGNIYFDTREAAQLALETFRDELIWYFTEYKDSL